MLTHQSHLEIIPMNIRLSIIGLLLLAPFCLVAQEELSLDDCIKIALENNLQVKRAENNVKIAKSNRVQALMEFLPNLNASGNYNFTFGTDFDNISGKFISTTTRNSRISAGSSLMLFNGFRNTYRLKRVKSTEESSRYTLESSKLDTESNILQAYLNVALDRERVRISEERVTLLNEQLEREVKRESVGVGNLEQVYNFRSQLANENLNLVTLTNAFKADKLRLIQLLNLPNTKDYKIRTYDFGDEDLILNNPDFQGIMQQALMFSPSLKSAQLDYEAARLGLKESFSSLSPTLTASAGIGSIYSSNILDENENTINYGTQINDNRSESVGFNLNIPIFNRFRSKNTIQVARLNMLNADIAQNEVEQNVKNNVQQVYLDLVAAQETYRASQENLKALDQSFKFVKQRYEEGLTDFYTYLESLNNKNRAEIELANAKYSIVFRKKILDLLQGV